MLASYKLMSVVAHMTIVRCSLTPSCTSWTAFRGLPVVEQPVAAVLTMCPHVHRATIALRMAAHSAAARRARAEDLRARVQARTIRPSFVSWRDVAIAMREVGACCVACCATSDLLHMVSSHLSMSALVC